MASTTAAPLPTSTQTFVALTTPYVQPSSCTNIRDLGIFQTNEYDSVLGSLSYKRITAIGSPIFHPKFSGCQPSGWDAPASWPTGRIVPALYFSPAVCPSDWATHSIYVSPMSYFDESSTETYTGAYCCKRYVQYILPPLKTIPSLLVLFTHLNTSGYEYRGNGEFLPWTSMKQYCMSTIKSGDGKTHVATITDNGFSKGQVTTITAGIHVHAAYAIEWQESDLPSLSPRPELVVNSVSSSPTTFEITTSPPTYNPSNEPSPTLAGYDPYVRTSSDNTRPVQISVMIGMPIISLLLIAGCIGCYRSNKKSKLRKKIALETEGIELGRVPREDGNTSSHSPAVRREGTVDAGLPAYEARGQDVVIPVPFAHLSGEGPPPYRPA